MGSGESFIIRNFRVCTVHLIWFKVIKSRSLSWTGHVARTEEDRSIFKILTVTPTAKGPLGRPRRKCEDYSRINLKEIGISTRNKVDSAEDKDYWRALVIATLNL